MLLAFFDKINLLTTLLLKLGQTFDEVAKLGKSTQDAYNPGKWLFLKALLKNWVSKGITSDVNDFNTYFLFISGQCIKKEEVVARTSLLVKDLKFCTIVLGYPRYPDISGFPVRASN